MLHQVFGPVEGVTRHTAIATTDAVDCDLLDGECAAVLYVPNYVKNPSLGTRKIRTGNTIIIEQVDAQSLKVGEEITLMHWGNAIVRDVVPTLRFTDADADAGSSCKDIASDLIVKRLVLELNPSSRDFKKAGKTTSLAAADRNKVIVELMAFDHLFAKDKLEPSDVLEDCLKPATQSTTHALANSNVMDLVQGAVVHFERKAYYRVNVRCGSTTVVFETPSGSR